MTGVTTHMNKAAREKARDRCTRLASEGYVVSAVARTTECSELLLSALDALDALESERDQLRKQVEGRADWMRKAETDVIAERRRQTEQEGWTPEHDARHAAGDLADAAACYASTDRDLRHGVPFGWPWSAAWWKPTDRRRDLVKAGALIIAEIERLDRVAILSAASALEQPVQCTGDHSENPWHDYVSDQPGVDEWVEFRRVRNDGTENWCGCRRTFSPEFNVGGLEWRHVPASTLEQKEQG